MYILGIHDGHNAAAALLKDGKIVAAIQEERVCRIKNKGGVPHGAIQEILRISGLKLPDIDMVALNGFYISYSHWERKALIDECRARTTLKGKIKGTLKQVKFIDNAYHHFLQEKRLTLISDLGIPRDKIISVDHHLAHAAAAYYGWGKYAEKILIITCDGQGDGLCASVNIGYQGNIERIAEISWKESIGSLYAIVTLLMGMIPLEHEYKIMGLSPYSGNSKDVERVYKKFSNFFKMNGRNPLRWQRTNGVPPMPYILGYLQKEMEYERFDWIAAGIQRCTEEVLSKWIQNCIQETGIRRLALSGGVFMNVKANKLIMELPEMEEMFIFPSCGDETNAIGAAYWVYAQEQIKSGKPVDIEPLGSIYWGGSFGDNEIEDAIKNYSFSCKVSVEFKDDIEKNVAELLAKGDIVARSKGKMEFGARALGNRSILANPSKPKVVKVINEMIKSRDFWMPFAPSVLDSRAQDYLKKPKDIKSPYMTLAFDSKPDRFDKFAASAHPYDYTLRPQEVSQEFNEDYYKLIKYFEEFTGDGIILNTSFNLHGYPIVYTPEDALQVFDHSGLKYLALGNHLLSKV